MPAFPASPRRPPSQTRSTRRLLSNVQYLLSMSSTPFPALLAHFLALNPDYSNPFSLYAPLLCAVLSKLNEPELILLLFDDLCDRLEPVPSGKVPDWVELISTEAREDLGEKEMAKLVVAVRIREALLKVSSTSPSLRPFPPVLLFSTQR